MKTGISLIALLATLLGAQDALAGEQGPAFGGGFAVQSHALAFQSHAFAAQSHRFSFEQSRPIIVDRRFVASRPVFVDRGLFVGGPIFVGPSVFATSPAFRPVFVPAPMFVERRFR